MRYKLPVDRLVNSLMPHYLSGRRFILFVQSCLYPLQSLNERFRAFARERHIEARMTSQVIYFEWFLNHRFGKYICDPGTAYSSVRAKVSAWISTMKTPSINGPTLSGTTERRYR